MLLVCYNAESQNLKSTLGRFSVNFSKGCTPFQVQVTEIIPLGQTFYTYTGQLVSEKTFTYNTPGKYTIYQFIQSDDNPQGKVDSVKIELKAKQDPEFNILTCPGNFVAVEILDDYYDFYKAFVTPKDTLIINAKQRSNFIYVDPALPSSITVQGFFDGGSPSCSSVTKTYQPQQQSTLGKITKITAVADTSVTIDFNLNGSSNHFLEKRENNGPFKQVGTNALTGTSISLRVNGALSPCFRIVNNDNCTGIKLSSDTVCAVILVAQSTTNGNRLLWNRAAVDTIKTQVFKNDSLIFDAVGSQYFDTDILCQQEECYFITQGVAESNKSCITGNKIFNLTGPVDMQSTFVGPELQLSWDIPRNPPVREYRLYIDEGDRTINSDDFTYTLVPDLSRKPEIYSIDYRDDCRNVSGISNKTSPIYFYKSEVSANEYIFSWTEYLGWENGVANYFLETRVDDTNWTRQTLPAGEDSITIKIDDLQNTYRVVAESTEVPARTTISNQISLQKNILLGIPTAFTPGGDGLNDEFRIVADNITNFKMYIFNRWGEVIFYSENINRGWDGNYLAKRMPEGSYTFKIEFDAEDGPGKTEVGNFALIRYK
jgi:gliding motility-associated-like protein